MSPDQILLAEHGVLSALATAAIVWAVAAFPRGNVEAAHDHDPAWWTWGLRTLAVVAGCGFGLALDWSVTGACVGLAGGACSTTVMGIVKARLRAVREGT